MISPANPTDTRKWTALQADGLGATLVLPLVSATVSAVAVKVNTATPGAPVLDWTANVNADADSTPGDPFAAVSVEVLGAPISLVDDSLVVSGELTGLNIADFIFGSADFEITLSTVAVDLPTPQPDIALASLLTIGLTDLDLTIGDLTGPHFSITGGSLALALLKPKTPAPGDTRSWLALKGSVTSASFDGVDNLTVEVINLSLEINRASGDVGGANAATPLDWAAALEDDVTAAGVAIDFSGDLLRASGVIRINIFDLVSGVVGFGFEQQVVDVDVDDNGSVDLVGATLTTLGLRIVPDDGNAGNGAEGLLRRRRRDRLQHRLGQPRARDRQARSAERSRPRRHSLLDGACRQRHRRLVRRHRRPDDGRQPAERRAQPGLGSHRDDRSAGAQLGDHDRPRGGRLLRG